MYLQKSSKFLAQKFVPLDSLEKAFRAAEEAVRTTPNGGSDYLLRNLNHLGLCHDRRFEELDNPDDSKKAIDIPKEAVDASPSYSTTHIDSLCNLGNRLECRFF